jgi:hypothetical protein
MIIGGIAVAGVPSAGAGYTVIQTSGGGATHQAPAAENTVTSSVQTNLAVAFSVSGSTAIYSLIGDAIQ